jgi:hypothetical protein
MNLRKHRDRRCYDNSSDLVRAGRLPYYVEGFAWHRIGGFPMEHAWNSDDGERAIDVTWKEPGMIYFGVLFSEHEMMKAICAASPYELLLEVRMRQYQPRRD